MAEYMDVSKNTIHAVETGKKFVRAEKIVKFANLFNVEVHKLFLPEELSINDPKRVLAKYTDEVMDAVENIRDDYIRNSEK